jgi:hypothetical protein
MDRKASDTVSNDHDVRRKGRRLHPNSSGKTEGGNMRTKTVADLLTEYAACSSSAELARLDAECKRAWRTASVTDKELLKPAMAAAKDRSGAAA